MLSVVDKFELLEHAQRLVGKRDFPGVIEVLNRLPASDLLADPELGHILALAYSQTDRQEEMRRLIWQLDRTCGNRGTDRLFRRRENLKAVSLVRQGRLAEASRSFRRVQAASELDGDVKFLATATMNLGVIADIECDWDVALGHYRYALVLFQRIGDRASTAGCYHNLGMLLRQRGEYFEAEAYFQRALENYQPHGTREERVATDLERSLAMLAIGDLAAAAALAQHALEQAGEMANDRLIGEALRTVGKVHMEGGDLESARTNIGKALRSPALRENPMLEAELHEEMAVIEFTAGSDGQARQHLEMACSSYGRLGSQRRAERARCRVTEAEVSAGSSGAPPRAF